MLFGFSQIASGKIVYEVDMDRMVEEINTKSVSDASDDLMRKTAEKASEFQLELIFNNEIALFRHPKALSIGENEFGNLVKSLICEGDYYSNLNKRVQIMITEFDGRIFNVINNFDDTPWILTKETKKIGQFICYKAVLEKDYPDGKKQIFAWYSPELPIPYGPKEYVGSLPGLILELNEPFTRYRFTSIDLDFVPEFLWPKEVKTITKGEYDKYFEVLWQKRSN